MVNIKNPYAEKGIWLKGSIHLHSNHSDGEISPSELLDQYNQKGYDFLSITDHDRITKARSSSIIVLDAIEITLPFKNQHLIALNIHRPPWDYKNAQEYIDDINQQGGLAIIAHPNQAHPHPGFTWSLEDISQLKGSLGLEIYNHLAELFYPSGYAIDKWDALLTAGLSPCFGFAVDDTHGMTGYPYNDEKRESPVSDQFGGWIMVLCQKRDEQSILESLKSGSFYASNGAIIEKIKVERGHLFVSTHNAHTIRFIGSGGATLHEERNEKSSYKIKGNEKYIRIECIGEKNRKAWAQPILVDS